MDTQDDGPQEMDLLRRLTLKHAQVQEAEKRIESLYESHAAERSRLEHELDDAAIQVRNLEELLFQKEEHIADVTERLEGSEKHSRNALEQLKETDGDVEVLRETTSRLQLAVQAGEASRQQLQDSLVKNEAHITDIEQKLMMAESEARSARDALANYKDNIRKFAQYRMDERWARMESESQITVEDPTTNAPSANELMHAKAPSQDLEAYHQSHDAINLQLNEIKSIVQATSISVNDQAQIFASNFDFKVTTLEQAIKDLNDLILGLHSRPRYSSLWHEFQAPPNVPPTLIDGRVPQVKQEDEPACLPEIQSDQVHITPAEEVSQRHEEIPDGTSVLHGHNADFRQLFALEDGSLSIHAIFTFLDELKTANTEYSGRVVGVAQGIRDICDLILGQVILNIPSEGRKYDNLRPERQEMGFQTDDSIAYSKSNVATQTTEDYSPEAESPRMQAYSQPLYPIFHIHGVVWVVTFVMIMIAVALKFERSEEVITPYVDVLCRQIPV